MQRMPVGSSRKTRHHSKERRSVVSCLQLLIIYLALPKMPKASKKQSKAKAQADSSLSKSSVFKHPHEYAAISFSKKSPRERFRKVAFSVIVFIVNVWTIAVSVTTETHTYMDGVLVSFPINSPLPPGQSRSPNQNRSQSHHRNLLQLLLVE